MKIALMALLLSFSLGCVHTRKNIVPSKGGHVQTLNNEEFTTLESTRFYGQSMYLLGCTEAQSSHGNNKPYDQCLKKAQANTRENFDEIFGNVMKEIGESNVRRETKKSH